MMSSNLRVLLVLGASTGGIGQHVRSLAAGLVARGHRVVVAGPPGTEKLFDFTGAGARFVPANVATTPSPRDLRVARELGRWVRGADVVHAHGFKAGMVALNAGAGVSWPTAGVRRALVPLVVTWHNQVLAGGAKGWAMHRVECLVARGASLNLGASADLVRQAEQCGGRAELGDVAPPARPTAVRDRDAVRHELGVAADEPVVLAVGRLTRQKDYPTLLAALAELRPHGPRPVLAIAGDGPDEAELVEQARELSVRLRLLGRRADIGDLMAAADVLAMSSVWEARALVVQEAMQMELPVVATGVGGIPELVGEDALVVPPSDPHALADAIAQVLDDPSGARERALRALERTSSWPDEDDVVERVLSAYADVGAGVGSGR